MLNNFFGTARYIFHKKGIILYDLYGKLLCIHLSFFSFLYIYFNTLHNLHKIVLLFLFIEKLSNSSTNCKINIKYIPIETQEYYTIIAILYLHTRTRTCTYIYIKMQVDFHFFLTICKRDDTSSSSFLLLFKFSWCYVVIFNLHIIMCTLRFRISIIIYILHIFVLFQNIFIYISIIILEDTSTWFHSLSKYCLLI